jgi:iron(III) transport system substrate-binding protein
MPAGPEEFLRAATAPTGTTARMRCTADVMMDRRQTLRLAGLSTLALLTSCVPTLGPSTGTAVPPADRSERWSALLAAARREGSVSLLTVPGTGYRALIDSFERTFPGVRVDHVIKPTIASWTSASRRRATDKTAAFDVGLIHSASVIANGRAEKAWAPLREQLFHAEILDNAAWRGGTAARFLDIDGDLCFGWEHQIIHAYAINTDFVRPGEITTARDLLDPKWRGRILSLDPHGGTALLSATSVAKAHGFEVVGRLLVDQRPVIDHSGSGSAVTESLARGDYPIALGVRPKALSPLRAKGVGQNVAYLDLVDADFVATNLLFSFAQAVHANAGALFANWMLTRDAQAVLTAGLRTNSARLDVAPSEPDGAALVTQSHYEPEREANNAHADATLRFVNGLAIK